MEFSERTGDLQHVETERLGGALVGRLRAPQAVQTAVDEPGEGRRPGENGDDHEQLRQRQQERRLQDLCHVVCGDGIHAQWDPFVLHASRCAIDGRNKS